jgi:hypothetical protein
LGGAKTPPGLKFEVMLPPTKLCRVRGATLNGPPPPDAPVNVTLIGEAVEL